VVSRRRYRLPRLPALALAIAIPLGIVMTITLFDVQIRRDLAVVFAVGIVILLSWIGGIWPGLLSTLLLLILLAGPLGGEQVDPPLDDLSLLLFSMAALVATGIIESLYRARWRSEAARDRARNSRRSEHDARAELESIVAAIGEGIIVSDEAGAVSLMNRAAVDLLGRPISRYEAVAQAFRGDEGELSPAELLSAEGPATAEYELVADGRRVELTSFPLLTEGVAPRRVLLLRDVTEARRRERVREAFLSLLAHELRTPMTAVYGGATLLLRIGDQIDAATRNELRADIAAEADRLSRLLDDLLVLTRMEGGAEVGREPALLQHLVGEVVAQDRGSVGGMPIELKVDVGLPPVIGDETSIRQVTHNLISNAVKYSAVGAPIEVHVEATDSDEVAVRVLDRGPGLEDADSPQVFEPFYRGRATANAAPGLGIGLFVCRRLVEAMGGRIWTAHREGGGSEFGFALGIWPIEPEDEDPTLIERPMARAGASW
jgi:signal transduction histidine kinase